MTLLSHFYDPNDGDATARHFWVKIPDDISVNNLLIDICYGKSAQASQSNWANAITYTDQQIAADMGMTDLSNTAFGSFNNKLWRVGGIVGGVYKAEVWSSDDGITWTQVTADGGFGVRTWTKLLSFDGKLWLFGGHNGVDLADVWYTTDGITWTQSTAAAWPARHAASACVALGKMWILGGVETGIGFWDDVWYSTDGVTWTLATDAPGWTSRQQAGFAYMNSKFWVWGGYGGAGAGQEDCWWSTDGVSWTQATANMGLVGDGRYGTLGTFMYDNRLWLVGGYSYSTAVAYNDVYYSTDGVTWTKLADNSSWDERYFDHCVVHNHLVYLMGGYAYAPATPEGYREDSYVVGRKYVEPTATIGTASDHKQGTNGFTYRKAIPVFAAAGAGTNYPIRVEVRAGAGDDSDGIIYLDNLCTDFPNDLAFYTHQVSGPFPVHLRI